MVNKIYQKNARPLPGVEPGPIDIAGEHATTNGSVGRLPISRQLVKLTGAMLASQSGGRLVVLPIRSIKLILFVGVTV